MIMADRVSYAYAPRAWIGGVCANLARRTGLPVWLWRLGAVFMLLCHAFAALVIYGVLVLLRARVAARGGDARDGLGPILAHVENARADREERLARAIRDLERRG